MDNATETMFVAYSEALSSDRGSHLPCPPPNSCSDCHVEVVHQREIHGNDSGVLYLTYRIQTRQNPSGPLVSSHSIQNSFNVRAWGKSLGLLQSYACADMMVVAEYHAQLRPYYGVASNLLQLLY